MQDEYFNHQSFVFYQFLPYSAHEVSNLVRQAFAMVVYICAVLKWMRRYGFVLSVWLGLVHCSLGVLQQHAEEKKKGRLV